MVAVLGACHARTPARSARGADPLLILTGGRIFTGDSTRPWVEALAVRGDRIAAVGTTTDVRRLAGQGAREIALDGRVVIPGINDAHDHLAEPALGPQFRTGTSPTPDPPASQVLDSVRALAGRTPAGTWLGTPVGMRVFADGAVGRTTLDRLALPTRSCYMPGGATVWC
jgi:predicted amidohydrolase YtcJ